MGMPALRNKIKEDSMKSIISLIVLVLFLFIMIVIINYQSPNLPPLNLIIIPTPTPYIPHYKPPYPNQNIIDEWNTTYRGIPAKIFYIDGHGIGSRSRKIVYLISSVTIELNTKENPSKYNRMVPKGYVYAMQISDIKYYLYDYMKTPDGNYISHDIYTIAEDHLIELAHKEMKIKK